MSDFAFLSPQSDDGPTADRVAGVVIGLVTNNRDEGGLGRVKVKFPWLSDQHESQWARIASPMAGNDRGLYFLPEVDDEVLVAFEHGDMRFPYVIGALWNGKDKPPANNEDGKNNVRVIRSRSGHEIRFGDEDGRETIAIVDSSGRNRIVVDTANNAITITSAGDLTLSAQGTIALQAKQVAIQSSAGTSVQAASTIDVNAGATTTIKGATVNIN